MMFEKIGEAAIFVGDVTLVGAVKEGRKVKKRLPSWPDAPLPLRVGGLKTIASQHSHLSGLKVLKSLPDLRLAVHHEGTLANNALTKRLSAHQQHPGILHSLEHQITSLSFKHRQGSITRILVPVNNQTSLQNQQGGGVPVFDQQLRELSR